MSKIIFNPNSINSVTDKLASTFLDSAGTPGIVFSQMKGNIVSNSASGLSNIETNTSANSYQQFEIGSQTKMFTAIATLQLAEEGKLKLGGLAKDYLPPDVLNGIANADKVTIKELLSMRSGIPNFTDIAGANGLPAFVEQALENPDSIFGANEAINLVKDIPANFMPNEKYEYSNTNYTILGKIIENITAKSLEEVLQNRIFKPLEMHDTSLIHTDAGQETMHGYANINGELIDTNGVNIDFWAEGGAISTTQDMLKFAHAVFSEGKLLNHHSLDLMTSKISLNAESADSKIYFGLGLAIIETDKTGTVYGFTGGTLGFDSSTYYSKSLDTGFSIANNASSDSLNLTDVFNSIANTGWKAPHFDSLDDRLVIQNHSAASLDIHPFLNHTTIEVQDVTLDLRFGINKLATENFSFTDGSVLIIGTNRNNTISLDEIRHSAINKDNQIFGLQGNDKIIGGKGNDKITGGAGSDTLEGGAGNDQFYMDAGRDIASGGTGNDTFILSSYKGIITDFSHDDVMDFSYFNTSFDKLDIYSNTHNTSIVAHGTSSDGIIVLDGFKGTVVAEDFIF